nr:cupredoxin domain-containing protein [uncultured Rhodopila sp.]
MRIVGSAVAIVLMAVAGLSAIAQPAPATTAQTVTVTLSNFAFEPENLRLKAGVPVRLRLVNESSGAHDFSAPAFFAASSFPPGTSAPKDGDVDVAGHDTVELNLIPRTAGTYRLRCTHFLHGLFGMHGSIEVSP